MDKVDTISSNGDKGISLSEEGLISFSSNIKNGNLNFHQFYNIEVQPAQFGFNQYMRKYKDNKRAKILNKTYYDIETYVGEDGAFTCPIKVDRPVNSIALYNNIKNEAYIICYITDCILQDRDLIMSSVKKHYLECCNIKSEYQIEGMKLEVFIEDDEKSLFKKYFQVLKEFNTLMLIGFNSSTFDDAFVFNRSEKLFGEDGRNNLASDFGIVNKYGDTSFDLPDYLLVDLLKLYKPVGSGGGGLGKSLPDFKLNTICKKELTLEKLDLETGFRETYLNDIVLYLTYNLLDTLLTFKLDEKLQFMELTYDLAKYNNSTMGAAITGRSFLYSYRNDLIYQKKDTLVRAKKFSKEVLYEPKLKNF